MCMSIHIHMLFVNPSAASGFWRAINCANTRLRICGIIPSVKDTISYEDFAKVDLRVGLIEKAENLENSEKLIRLTVDFGEDGVKTILTGLRQWYTPDDFKRGHFVFVLNLESKEMAGEESQGMLLCVSSEEKPLPVRAPEGSEAGDRLK